jgi:hypothetical protein
MNMHIVQLIRQRFHPLVRFCGPQSAGRDCARGLWGKCGGILLYVILKG